MTRDEHLETFLSQAKKREKEYNWLEASELYNQALGMVGKKDFLRKGKIQEKIGHCFHRAAFQAESREEFRKGMQRAVEAYEKAHGFYERVTDEREASRMFRCDAIVKYLGYWLTSDPAEKRKLLDECLELEDKALAVFSESGDMLEYGRTYNELSLVFYLRYSVEWDRQIWNSVFKRGLKWGEKAVAALSKLSDSYELAKAYFTLSTCISRLTFFIAEPEKKEQRRLKVVKYLSEAVGLSEKAGDAHLLGLSQWWLGYETGEEESLKHFEKTLECGEQTRDNFLIGMGLDGLAEMTIWRASATEDPEKRMELAEKGLQFCDKTRHHLSTISFMTAVCAFEMCDAYFHLATWETDTEKRREFLEKAEKAGMEALKLAEDSDTPRLIAYVLTVVSKALEGRACTEPDPSEKRSRLERALAYQKKAIEINEKLFPFSYWSLGNMENHLAEIKVELSSTEPELDTKRRLLEEAVLSKEKCLSLINKMILYVEKVGFVTYFYDIYGYQDSYATLLTRLYSLTSNPEHLRKATEISQKAIESASKLDLVSLIAESYWKIAKAQDNLGEHLEAAESFEHASESYMKAAEKIPQLRGFYRDHASYMQAWNEIEKAKQHRVEKHYGKAKEHYEKAAELHKSTDRWNHLSPNYSAWARLEEAEDLSRREQTKDAIGLFQQAANLFVEAKKSIQPKLERVESRDEKELLVNIVKASDVRRGYCLGRIALEEAKILDRQGNHAASSRKYGSAAEGFQKASDTAEHELDRKELKPIICLCRAWQMMTQAEAEASPDLYLEASQLFDEAKEHSLDEKARVLALAHSRFCKALEAGIKFEDTRDATIHLTVKKHIEAAANYYLKAGFKTASEYAKATHRLFDAYAFTYKAHTETDLQKKAQFYQVAEKLLQASAGSYIKAKHLEKGEEVQRLYESVKEERQLAVSLAEVLHAPSMTSTTASFSTPNPIYEKAVGLERFEHAHVQANIFTHLKEVKVGENVALEIELVNAGKGPATLVKIEDIIPAGFKVIEKPDMYRVEDSCLNMKGKRLDPLKSEEAKIVIKPQSKGTFPIKPRVLYIDETGKYEAHEPESVTITVKELGIKGWIKGER